MLNYSILSQLSYHYKAVCVHMPGEVYSFNVHCSALTGAAPAKSDENL